MNQKMPELESEQRYAQTRDKSVIWRVKATIIRRDLNLAAEHLRAIHGLEDLSIFRRDTVQQATAFAVTADQATILLALEELRGAAEQRVEEEMVTAIRQSPQIPKTTKEALIKARVGQGPFRDALIKIEKRCRLTGVTNPEHLIASHCKPWKDSNDRERLDGNNGLLLSPNIDHLFDKGVISFSDQGELLISQRADRVSLKKLGVQTEKPVTVGSFSFAQRKYGCVEQSVGQHGTLARSSTRLECVPGWHSKPLPAGRMSFSLWTVDCRGIRGQRNRVVTRRRHSSQALLGLENRAFLALRANRLPANCSDQAEILSLPSREGLRKMLSQQG